LLPVRYPKLLMVKGMVWIKKFLMDMDKVWIKKIMNMNMKIPLLISYSTSLPIDSPTLYDF
jgi:hypothetical protein